MANLKEVKTRINSVVSTQQITKAMKMVAAAKLRRSQDRILQMRPFARKLQDILQNLSAAADEAQWYNTRREENRVLIVALSSDRGLCGSFNTAINKAVLSLLNDKYSSQHKRGDVTILPIGKKVYEYFSKRKYKVMGDHWNLYHALTFESSSAVAEKLMEAFRRSEYDTITVVYNEFKNVATQILRTEQFLPVQPLTAEKTTKTDYIYQPDQSEIMTGLIPKSLKVQLFKALLDSNASENGARMTAMDKANENAGELLKELRLTYNRTRQAAITKEINEIVAGAEALK
jgi:F-type H+-transporting ATPase subunit gamma